MNRDKEGNLIYCEHNRKGLLLYSLYGRFRVYTCAKDLRGGMFERKPWLAGWEEPCEYICRNAPKGTKYIPFEKMQKNEECLRQEQEEKQEKLREATKLRTEADYNISKAKRLEKEVTEENTE